MSELSLQLIAENKKTKNPFLDLGNCGLNNYLPEELLDCVWLERLNLGDWYYNFAIEGWIASSNQKGENLFRGDELNVLKNLINLTNLDFSSIEITDFSFLANLTNLTNLDLSSNKITDFSFLVNLTNITNLYLNDNQVTGLSFLANLTNLSILDLSDNQITDFRSLEKLINLTNLYLRSSQITDIGFLEKLINLTHLDLRSNEITDLSFLENLANLTNLDISSNKISDIRFLEKLTKLTNLYLVDNEITDLSFLANLTNLTHLDLSTNKIKDLSFLVNLTNLKTLDLSYNELVDLSFLANLTNLIHLDLRGNQITDITPIVPLIQRGITISLEELDWDKNINLYNNPITTPPMHIVEQGSEAILRYFSAGKLWPLNECKLIFVGDGGVGKTCLMKRIVENTFNDTEKQTHGINKIAWKKISNIHGEKVKVNLWDFGGQDIQHSLHQFFFTERVIYILVLNPRNDEKAAYWLEQIEKLGADSEVLVVYNWKDAKDLEAPYMSNFYELRKKYNKLNNPFELSVKTGKGVDDFRVSLKEAILRNEGLVQQYPEKWFNIKQKLEENVSVGENYIKYELYEKWCNDFDYTDESDQKALLVTLDKIGSIVFFDKPILNSLQVLNPEWITTGAYAILTSELTKLKKGHLTNRDLKKIFSKEIEIFSNTEVKIKYNEGQFLYIIELMSSYDLCQENPLKRHEYLIPSAFGAKPNNNYDEHKKDARQYRIQFDSPFEMLIIHRFIAKNLSKVQGEDYWQSGIFIKDNSSDTFALVETNLHSSRIDFWIKGDNIRGFWEAMRRDFHDIFSIYKKFSYQEKVLYKHDNGEVFLPYHEMLDSLRNNVSIIPYHPTYQLKDINVLAVLDLFEDAKATEITIRKEMEQKGNTYNFYGKVENSQVGGKGNTQTIINNADSSKSDDFNEIKKILLELQEANVNNELWKSTLLKCLDEFTKLEEVEDASAQKGIVDTSFSFLKNVKDFIDVSLLPVAVVEGFPKLLSLWDSFKSSI